MRWLREEFTLVRWRANPFQMLSTLSLGVWSFLQISKGVLPDSVLGTQVDRSAQVVISFTSIFGMLICMVGLHLRDLATALWVEVIGYVSLVGSLGIYLYLVAEKTTYLNTAPGVGLSYAFIGASVWRTAQIFALKRAERRTRALHSMLARQEVADTENEDDDRG